MTGTSYRVRLRAVISDYHQVAITEADSEHDAAATVLATLLGADLSPAQIVPAIDAAMEECVSAGVRVLLRRARSEVIGDSITTARAANEAVNVRLVDHDHRRSA
ncbi:hypothetical protein [Williamsia herbipolensis]|uniref:hypothetical protein n=1 Tax=Williamsia herbipolensis TaxID=1603258 RepID=UPI000B28B1D7|nr:hypothetical protein [Williamsia herbipolensis]